MDFSSLNPESSNSLSIAARKNDLNAVKKLIKVINLNCIDNRGWNCLHESAANDSFECLLLILKNKNCRPLAETHEGHTALYLACRYNSSIKTIQALLESESDIANYGSTECVTPLHIASIQGRIELIQLLLENNAILDLQDFDGDTPLHDAAFAKQPEAANVLLHAGADPEIKNYSHCTPFHLACLKGCYSTFYNLFPFVTNINQLTINNDTPLLLAVQGCNSDIVDYLLDHGADPHIPNKDGDLPIDIALILGNSKIFKKLLYATDRIEIKSSIILSACKPHSFQFDILKELLYYDLGPEFFYYEVFYVTLEEIGGILPTYTTNASLNSYLNICEYIYSFSPEIFVEFFYLFLMRGTNVNANENSECPPLVYLHYCEHSLCFAEVFKILIENDCDVDYCTTTSANLLLPDAFLASLTVDPSTALIMLPYSGRCEPGIFLKFAYDNEVIERIPLQVQKQLLSLIYDHEENLSVESMQYFVAPMKHLCRLSIRSFLRISGVETSKDFLNAINKLEVPLLLKNYLRYL